MIDAPSIHDVYTVTRSICGPFSASDVRQHLLGNSAVFSETDLRYVQKKIVYRLNTLWHQGYLTHDEQGNWVKTEPPRFTQRKDWEVSE